MELKPSTGSVLSFSLRYSVIPGYGNIAGENQIPCTPEFYLDKPENQHLRPSEASECEPLRLAGRDPISLGYTGRWSVYPREMGSVYPSLSALQDWQQAHGLVLQLLQGQ